MTFPFSGLKKLTLFKKTTDIPTIPYLSWDGGEAACAWVEENAGNPAASPKGGSWGSWRAKRVERRVCAMAHP